MKKINNWEVLTDSGWSKFDGVVCTGERDVLEIKTEDNSIVSTLDHGVFLNDGSKIPASNVKPGDLLFGHNEVLSKEQAGRSITFDLVNVEKGHRFLSNNLLCSNCAFIAPHIMDEFWNSVVPIISSSKKTKIFLISTSNGTSNKFYDIYSKAERGESSEWRAERMDWWEIPGRDDKWKQNMIESLGSIQAFDQEFGNLFLETGESAISTTVLDRWRNHRKPAILTLEQGHYKIWEAPIAGHIYSIGVDVSEGVGEAASVVQVLDITNLSNIRQVACFHDALIDPYFFAEVIYKIANQWGRPYLAVERNNAGGQVLDVLYHTHGYTKFLNIVTKGGAQDRLGIYSSTGTKYRGVTNMRYWINTLDVLEVNDIGLVQELETFIRRPNGVWKKKDGPGVRDDRVDALFWALMILDTEYAEQYFNVSEFDDRGRPKKLELVEIESPEFYKLDEFYQKNQNAPSPLLFGFEADDPDNPSVGELAKQGWRLA